MLKQMLEKGASAASDARFHDAVFILEANVGFVNIHEHLADDDEREERERAPRSVRAEETEVRLLPIRPRSRGARRSLRTFPVVTLHPRFPFNV